MPLNGSDIASKPAGSTAVANQTIESSPFNSVIDDIYSILNTVRTVAKGYTGANTEAGAIKSLKIGRYQTKSSGYTAVLADLGTFFRITDAVTLAMTAAATLGTGWWCMVLADGGDVTVDPDSSETINGSATLTISDGDWAIIKTDGTAFYALTNSDLTVLDEDDMASDSATQPPSQQSVKAWTTGDHAIWIPAAAMWPAATNGASYGTTEESSNAHNYVTLDFDASTDEYACFEIAMPESWDEGTLAFKAVWSSTAADTDGVSWALQAVAVADGDNSDVAYGTAVVIDDANQSSAGDVLITAKSGALTVAGSPSAGELTQFRVFRDVSDANDTAAEDAQLRGLYIYYTTDMVTDA